MLFLNRSYWPDAEATGQLLTELCEDLSATFDVTVIAGQPNQNPDHTAYRRVGTEHHNGVTVRRVPHSRFPKRSFPGRVVNLLSYLIGAMLSALTTPRPDVVVVETDPPLLCLLGKFLKHWFGCQLVVYLQDIYPDVAIALGKLRPGWFTHLLRKLFYGTYRQADRVVVLSDDMRRLLVASGVPKHRIACVPNWADTAQVRPLNADNTFRHRHGINGEFVVMYSGNLGLTQRLEPLLDAADHLRDRKDILFLLVGDGASKAALQHSARQRNLCNIRFLPYQPKHELAQSLGAANLQFVPLDPRIADCLMPSKLYGVLAAGTAVLAMASETCKLSRIVRQHELGLVVPPDDSKELAENIRWSADNRRQVHTMGENGRRCAVSHYDRHDVTGRFAQLLQSISGMNHA